MAMRASRDGEGIGSRLNGFGRLMGLRFTTTRYGRFDHGQQGSHSSWE